MKRLPVKLRPLRWGALVIMLATIACQQQTVQPEDITEEDSRDFGPFAALATATSTEIYALHPYPYHEDGKPVTDGFHGYRILGQTTLDSEPSRDLLANVARSVASSDGAIASCFNPRHGIRCQVGDDTIDLVICFECRQIYEHIKSSGEKIQHLNGDAGVAAVNRQFVKHGLEIHRNK